MRFDKDAIKDLLLIIVLPALLVIAAFWIAARYVQPAPPNAFVMTTGAAGGAYQLFAQRYRDILAREKITITLKPSAGAMENLQRLQDAGSEVQVGLVQAGMVTGDPPPGLHSLGAMYYEPLWIFYRGNAEIDKLSQLSGIRLSAATMPPRLSSKARSMRHCSSPHRTYRQFASWRKQTTYGSQASRKLRRSPAASRS